ncbi:conjugal transfer protein [Pseudalkalibacillus sp. SCS-8]|uniref:conjugal transfer protein n=1 Tax=Pseudalkalibacillus nanhaiensis TaxID=3115291 RepID=UPI0032DB0480
MKRKRKPSEKMNKEKGARKVPYSRRTATRITSIVFFTVILFSLVFNVIFFSKYQTIRNSVKAQENSIEEELNQVHDSNLIHSHSIVVFTDQFLQQYFGIPESEDERKKRLETLSTYFVSGYDLQRLGNLDDFKGSRVLKDLQYMDTEQISRNQANVHFIAKYEIVENPGESKEGDNKENDPKKVANRVEIVVPVTTDGKGYAVYQNPRLVESDLRTTMNAEPNELEGELPTSSEYKKLQSFLTEFFTSYGTSDEKLPFMAEVERGLNDQILQSVTIRQVAKDHRASYRAIVDVQYQNNQTSLNSLYTYKLQLSFENNKFFIESME